MSDFGLDEMRMQIAQLRAQVAQLLQQQATVPKFDFAPERGGIQGRHEYRSVIVPDGDCTHQDLPPFRKTTEHNPQTTDHKGELQLYDVDTAEKESKSVPYVMPDADGSCSLIWCAIDATRPTPSQQSLDVFDDNGVKVAQIKGWKDATATTLAAGDLLLARKSSGKDAKYLDAAAFKGDKGDTGATGATGPVGPAGTTLHHALTDLTANDDHNGGSAKYIKDNGDATRNAMSGVLGDSSARISVQPDARTLNDQDGAATVAWGTADRFLQLLWTIRGGNFRVGYNSGGSVDASFVYQHGAHLGKSHDETKKIVLTDADGNAVECVLRGGILCVD